MRKKIISSTERQDAFIDSKKEWLDLDKLAVVEVTSEEYSHPIESALLPGGEGGWRASTPGKQTIRLLFDTPQKVQHIKLSFQESENERTQEYVLRWSPDDGRTYHEIIRQQWNFSPEGATVEIEEHQTHLPDVTSLELSIIPDISDKKAFASLEKLRLC